MSNKWVVIGAVGLSGVFASCGGHSSQPKERAVKHEVKREAEREVEIKESLIYRNGAREYRADYDARAEAYLGQNGREVRNGEDFAMHVGLFDKGGISVLIAEGPNIGIRLEFFPVDYQAEAGSSVTYSRLAREVTGADGRTAIEILPEAEQFSITRSMKLQDQGAQDIAHAFRSVSPWFTKTMIDGGEAAEAFSVMGKPWKEDQFTITVWNGDSYSFDLKTGAYSFNSAFLHHSNYLQDFESTGIELTQDDIPVIRGVLPIRQPKVQPAAAPGI